MTGPDPNSDPSKFDALLNTSTPFAPADEAEVRSRLLPLQQQDPEQIPREQETDQDHTFEVLVWATESDDSAIPEQAPYLDHFVESEVFEESESGQRKYEAIQAALQRSMEESSRMYELLAEKPISLQSADGGVHIEAAGIGEIRSLVISREAARPNVIRKLERELVHLLNQVGIVAEEQKAGVRQQFEYLEEQDEDSRQGERGSGEGLGGPSSRIR